MKTFIKSFLFVALGLVAGIASAQEPSPAVSLESFNKIVASPRVNVILTKGDTETISIIYNEIPESKVNVVVKNHKLKIYLDHARFIEKQGRHGIDGRHGIYHGSSITVYVTYKNLKSVEMRGEEELRCDSDLTANKFKLKAYGESEIQLASLHVQKFKASLYGQNTLKVVSGETDSQVYRVFGENKIDTRGLKSINASTRVYGEGKIAVNASDEVHIMAIGEPIINVEGTSFVNRGIILGRARIHTN